MSCVVGSCTSGGSYTCSICEGTICHDHTSHERSGGNYCPVHASAVMGKRAGIVFSSPLVADLGTPLDYAVATLPDLELIDSVHSWALDLRSSGPPVRLPNASRTHADYWSEVIGGAIQWASAQEHNDLLKFVVNSARDNRRLFPRLAAGALGFASWAVGIVEPGYWFHPASEEELLATAQLPREMVSLLRDYPASLEEEADGVEAGV